MKKTIHIHQHLPSTVTTRQAVNLLKGEIPLNYKSVVIFDFTGIDFISRAFADELIHLIVENKITAEFQHANIVVNEILEVVKKNRGKRNSSFHHIAITPFKDQNELVNFLSLL